MCSCAAVMPRKTHHAGKSAEEFVEAELKATLEGLARHLFGQETEVRWGEWNARHAPCAAYSRCSLRQLCTAASGVTCLQKPQGVPPAACNSPTQQ